MQKLYTEKSENFSSETQLARLVAKLMQVEGLQIVQVALEDEALRRKSLTGRFPVLEDTEKSGTLVNGGLAIARYFSSANALFCSGSDVQ